MKRQFKILVWAFEVESCCLAFQRGGGVTGLPQVVFSEFPWVRGETVLGRGLPTLALKRLHQVKFLNSLPVYTEDTSRS